MQLQMDQLYLVQIYLDNDMCAKINDIGTQATAAQAMVNSESNDIPSLSSPPTFYAGDTTYLYFGLWRITTKKPLYLVFDPAGYPLI